MPAKLTFLFCILKVLPLTFAIVSVVIIAFAAFIQLVWEVFFLPSISLGIFFSIFLIGNFSPITPVEAK